MGRPNWIGPIRRRRWRGSKLDERKGKRVVVKKRMMLRAPDHAKLGAEKKDAAPHTNTAASLLSKVYTLKKDCHIVAVLAFIRH